MKTKRAALAALLLVTAASAATAERKPMALGDYAESMRTELKNGAVRLYTDVMKLSDSEAKVFWPLYHAYEKERSKLGDQQIELVSQFAEIQASGTPNNEQAAALAKKWFGLQDARLNLWKKYHKDIAKALSPTRAAQFVQIEYDIAMVINLGVAARMPLIGTPGEITAPSP